MPTKTSTEHKPVANFGFSSIAEFTKYAEKHEPAPNRGHILEVFTNMDMRFGHDGLEGFARTRHIDVKKLIPGQFVVFVNVARDRIKVFASSNIVAYMRLERGRKVDMRIIQEIPRAFNATGRIDYDDLLREAVEKALARKGRTVAPQPVTNN